VLNGFILILALLPSALLAAGAGRHLPRGEEHPQTIEVVFNSPFGEVQFTSVGKGHSGFLRNAKGALMGFAEVRGPTECETWFHSDKGAPLPAGCEFVFYDSEDGRSLGVRSGEMEETDLFQTTRGKLRGWRDYVAL
jgi:hypothetical protein